MKKGAAKTKSRTSTNNLEEAYKHFQEAYKALRGFIDAKKAEAIRQSFKTQKS